MFAIWVILRYNKESKFQILNFGVIVMELDITVWKVVSANRLRNNVSENAIHHRGRKRWAVALKRTGKTWYTVNGKKILSDSLHPVILPKGSHYSWQCVEAGECLLIEFDAPQTCADILSFSLSDSSLFENAFAEIQKNLHIASTSARLICMYHLYGLLLQLYQSSTREYLPRQKQALIQPAIDHITQRYFEPDINNDSLAALCGISTVYFRKTFEAVCGMPPIRFLHNLRIRRAKDILESDYDSIAQVAESVGYNSVYHFSKMFRTYTGISPTEYAKKIRQ